MTAICRVRIFVNQASLVFAVLTDLGLKNTGPSVTNSIKVVRSALINKGYVDRRVRLVDHAEVWLTTAFSLVNFDAQEQPLWKDIVKQDLIALLDCDADEFETKSLEHKRLFDEVERIRHRINPFIDEPYPKTPEVIVRQEEIKANMLPLMQLERLIRAGALEQKIQKLVKTDLSLFAEVYANPSDEYICFSEFPIKDGSVDFVLFSGRSKMDVTLIEVKGADYNLVTSNSYEDFSAKCNQSVQQIRKRLGYINRNRLSFEQEVHNIRTRVEKGEKLFNSFVGPEGTLKVDPEKSVRLHTVVIGGRGKNDLRESELRFEYENAFQPSIRVESWDSWLKKLRRS